MKITRKNASVLSLLLATCLGITACSSGNNAAAPQEGSAGNAPVEKKASEQVLNLYQTTDLPTMNTLGSYTSVSSETFNNVLEGLLRFDNDGKLIPAAAEKYEVSEDQKTYTFHIRQGAKWSNGTPVTSHDFDFAWKRAHAQATLSSMVYVFAPIKNSTAILDEKSPLYNKPEELGVKTPDDNTLIVELDQPTPYFLNLMPTTSFKPQNKEYVESQGEKYAMEAANLITNGPFLFTSWEHEVGWKLAKNPEYWDAANVKLEKINFKVVKDTATAVNLYDTGELDKVELTSEFVDQYKSSPEYSTYLTPSMTFMRLNEKNKFLANANIRRALDMGWDKSGVEAILNNGAIGATYLVPKEYYTTPDGSDFRAKYAGFNTQGPEAAKAAWETGLKELGETAVALEILVADTETNKTISQYLKNQWEKNLPGLTLSINLQPSKQRTNLEKTLKYDMTVGSWSPDFLDPTTYLAMFTIGHSYNRSNYASEKYDGLLKAAAAELDPQKRIETLQEAERVLIEEDAAILPIYQAGKARLTKEYFKNFFPSTKGNSPAYQWSYVEGK